VALQTQAAAPLEKAARQDMANWAEWILNVGFLGLARVGQGEVASGMAEVERPLALAQAIHNNTGLTIGHIFIAFGCLLIGDMRRLISAAQAALEFAHKSNELLPIFHAHGFLAWAESRAGRFAAARQHWSEMKAAGERLGGQAYLSDWFAAAEAELALNEGRPLDASHLAEQAVTVARASGGLLAEGWARRTWAQALMKQQQWEEAEAQLSQSLALFEAGSARLEAARTHLVWGEGCQHIGKAGDARLHLEQAAAQFEASGLSDELARARRLLAEIS
jgi:tetratricopeptide (TPR) repeat protein